MELLCRLSPIFQPRSRLCRSQRGQATLEFVGLIPVFAVVAALVLQSIALALTLVFAEVALGDAARASGPKSAQSAARSAVPAPWHSGVAVKQGGSTLTVSLRVPHILPLPKDLSQVTASGRTSA